MKHVLQSPQLLDQMCAQMVTNWLSSFKLQNGTSYQRSLSTARTLYVEKHYNTQRVATALSSRKEQLKLTLTPDRKKVNKEKSK